MFENSILVNTLLIIVAYLLGSIPSAVWIGKRFYGVDVREQGSKNAGATNTLRVLGRKAALPVFAIDIAKGFVAVKLSYLSAYSSQSEAFFYLQIGLIAAAVIGHILPIFASFKGGKGVATTAGAVLAVSTPAALLSVLVFAIVLIISKYVSLGSVIAGFSYPIFLIVLPDSHTPIVVFGVVVACLLVVTHRKNIKRLIKHEESKIYVFKRKKSE